LAQGPAWCALESAAMPDKGEKRKTKGKKAPAKKAKVAVTNLTPAEIRRLAKERESVTEDTIEPVNRWWTKYEDGTLAKASEDTRKWTSLEHHGYMFAPAYVPHGIPLIYENEKVVLPPRAEEVANFWIRVIGTDHEKKPQFRRNFWAAFSELIDRSSKIKSLDKCDFSLIKQYFDDKKVAKAARTKEEKDAEKAEIAKQCAPYTHALVNGMRERTGSFRVEPPELFRGRGDHPRTGMLKRRIFPEDLTINVAKDAPVPKASLPGHAWGAVVHHNTVTWLGHYRDSITDETKYFMLGPMSSFKGENDLLKYERARRLKLKIGEIRTTYMKMLKARSVADRQLAAATYLIDRLALRVGGEKSEDEADTVGCCSLRVEHVKCIEDNQVVFDFLGKDSVRYFETKKLDPEVYQAVKSFTVGKVPTAQLFDAVDPGLVNDFFKRFMDDLSAKVFRTYNASITLQTELDKFDASGINTVNMADVLHFYNNANKEVAVLCNHQKDVGKQHGEGVQKMQDRIANLRAERKELQRVLDVWQGKKEAKEDDKASGNEAAQEQKIAAKDVSIYNLTKQMEIKEDNKNVSLGTSKLNYMDPRITVAFCKKRELEIEKVFPATVRGKFPWAMYAKSTYRF